MASQPGSIDLGRIISNTFGVLGRHPLVFFGAAFLLMALPLGLIGLIFGIGNTSTTMFDFSATVLLGGLVTTVLTVALSALVQGAMIVATINDLSGKPVDFTACLQRTIPKILPLIGLGILVGLGVGIGFILLIVPGLILLVMWVVATPVLMAENRGIIESMRRSAELTKGSRWTIFALLVIYFIIAIVVGAIIGLFAFAGGEIVSVVLNIVTSTITTAISAAGVAAIYIELRNVKEGTDTSTLANVFA